MWRREGGFLQPLEPARYWGRWRFLIDTKPMPRFGVRGSAVGFVCLLHFSTAIESISFNPLELTEFMLRVLCGFRSLFGVRSFLILLNFHVESPPLFLLPLFLLPLFLSLSLSFEHAL